MQHGRELRLVTPQQALWETQGRRRLLVGKGQREMQGVHVVAPGGPESGAREREGKGV